MATCESYTQGDDATVIGVFSRATECIAPICTDGITSPAIPMQVARGKVELRDGTAERPINLRRLQVVPNATPTNLLFLKVNGDLAKWDLSSLTGKKRLVIIDGVLVAEDDVFPTIAPITMCAETCAGVEFHVGVKEITIEGEDVLQLVLVPISCCEEDTPVEDGNTYLTLNLP